MAARKPKKPPADPGPVPEDQGPDVTIADFWAAVEPGARMSKGVYSIYKTTEGGMHISYRPDGTETDCHLPVPPALVAMMMSAAEGRGPLARLRAVAGAMVG